MMNCCCVCLGECEGEWVSMGAVSECVVLLVWVSEWGLVSEHGCGGSGGSGLLVCVWVSGHVGSGLLVCVSGWVWGWVSDEHGGSEWVYWYVGLGEWLSVLVWVSVLVCWSGWVWGWVSEHGSVGEWVRVSEWASYNNERQRSVWCLDCSSF